MIKIDIVSDTVCPWCYIGKRKLEKALDQAPEGTEVEIAWRPFQLNPDMPAEGMDKKEYFKLKFGDGGGGQMYQAVKDAASAAGLDMAFEKMERQPNTILSHRLIDRAGKEDRQDAVVERLFKAYFHEGRDIGNVDTLVELAAEAGMDAEATRRYLESDDDAERVQAEDQMARQMGVQGVPCFIFNGKYAVSGAQDPEVFLQVFEMLEKEAAEGGASAGDLGPGEQG